MSAVGLYGTLPSDVNDLKALRSVYENQERCEQDAKKVSWKLLKQTY